MKKMRQKMIWKKISAILLAVVAAAGLITAAENISGVGTVSAEAAETRVSTVSASSSTWINGNGKWYLSDGGQYLTGWQKVNNVWYYLKPDCTMAASEWYDGYWLSSNGAWTYPYKGSWRQNARGWWFGDTSGWYAKDETVRINGRDYLFDAEGYWVDVKTTSIPIVTRITYEDGSKVNSSNVTYDKYGFISQYKVFTKKEELTYTLTYDKNHNLSKQVQKVKSKGKTKTTTQSYSYDGSRLAKSVMKKSGSKTTTVFNYNAKGVLTSAKQTVKTKKGKETTNYKFKFSNGNKIQMTSASKKAKLESKYEYTNAGVLYSTRTENVKEDDLVHYRYLNIGYHRRMGDPVSYLHRSEITEDDASGRRTITIQYYEYDMRDVDVSLADAIQAQQRKLLGGVLWEDVLYQ